MANPPQMETWSTLETSTHTLPPVSCILTRLQPRSVHYPLIKKYALPHFFILYIVEKVIYYLRLYIQLPADCRCFFVLN